MYSKRPVGKDDTNASGSSKKLKLDSKHVAWTVFQKNLRNEEYTVGWICAIPTEYVAAQVFLDATHGQPERVPHNDNNNYILGEIGEHNIVIAVLPKGVYGTTSATSVAKDMLRTFPNIKIGLMVGIGGGAPSPKHDIRLGDIVVSTPYNKEGGVLQYDVGKAIQKKQFKVTGHLNQPPTVLQTAVSGLEAHYELHGHQFQNTINNILENHPRLKKKYKRPDPNTDKLYLSRVLHPDDDDTNCIQVCSSDPSDLISQEPRLSDQNNPAVHYGIVASGNKLMKDALLRDKFARENDVLCFEMEAAGLMNHFPCLVIRGICDYSDSHKNKVWQGYAAMAASAYARDLLSSIPVNKIVAESRINDVLSSVEKKVDETGHDVKSLAFEWREKEIKCWLSPPDPSTSHNKALQKRLEGTGQWLLHRDIFETWKSQRNSFLWLYGIPGCGKTILSSTIIEHIRSVLPSQPLLYFYFDFTDTEKQTLRGAVQSLISQLYHTSKDTQEPLDALFSSSKNGNTQPSCESLCKVLLQMVGRTKRVWIILDALDECRERKGRLMEGLFPWIRDLVNSDQKNVHVLVTSRPEQDIQSGLSGIASEKYKICIQSDLVNGDISAYIHAQVMGGEGLKRWQGHQNVQKEIEERLVQKASGMFRWAACQIDALEDCLDYPSLRSALDSLPQTLDETYTRILTAIPETHKQTALRILQFLTFSKRPLTIEEAVDAIAVNVDGSPYFSPKNRMPEPLEITRYCSSLVVIVPKETKPRGKNYKDIELQLAHFSVKEFLRSTRLNSNIMQDFQDTTANASLANVCVAYLLYFEKWFSLEDVRTKFPFAQYSAEFWMDHARVAENGKRERTDLIERLLYHQKASYNLCCSLYQPDQPSNQCFTEHRDSTGSALYYMAFKGLEKAAAALLDKGVDVNERGGYCGSALQAASYRGYEQIVKLLLDKGADVNAQGGNYGNALYASSYSGHEQVVKILLEKGADVNAHGGRYGSALQAASVKGREQTVQLLLDKGAKVNAQYGQCINALYTASERGWKQVVEILLDNGANVNAKGGQYVNALQAASVKGHELIVKLLLDKGADIHAKGRYYTNALYAASERGHEQVVKILLEKGADVNEEGRAHFNALYAASEGGHEQVVKLLLSKGAEINAHDRRYGDSLYVASFRGYKYVVKLLLNKGANVNAQGGYYGNALQVALVEGHMQIGRILLDKGANVNAQGGFYGNALQAASENGHEQAVNLLLDKGADVNAQGGYYGNAIQAASARGHKNIVELLRNSGAYF